MKDNITKIALVIVCLALLCKVSEAQLGGGGGGFGGGGGGGSGGSSGGFSGGGWGRHHSKGNINFITLLGLQSKRIKLTSSEKIAIWFIRIVFLTIGSFAIHLGYKSKLQRDNAKATQKIIYEFKNANDREQPAMPREQRKALIDSLKSKEFIMTFQQKKQEKTYTCRMHIKLVFKLSEFVYDLVFRGNDNFGSFDMEGPLVLTKEGIEIKLLKKYENQKLTGQTGTFQNLLYQGRGSIDQCEGTWTYVGHEKEDKYNGIWKMVTQGQ